jgi:precorrin-2/cobalt-factor-2 C20-methyltransferase
VSKAGAIWGVGVGPGDPELLTLKAHRIVTTADVIAYPAPNDGDSLARSIVADHLPGGQEEIAIRIPMDPRDFPPVAVYDAAARNIAARADAGKTVAVLCEGDPFFYGSFMYLFEKLAESRPVAIVPGVSSLTASAAALGLPLAARNDVVTVIPATLADGDIARRLAAADTAVFIKVGRHLGRLKALLARENMLEGARYIERATMDAEKRMALAETSGDSAPYFSMVLLRRDRTA